MPKIYVIGFYLLTWVYFNDVNVGRSTVINSQLKRILLLAAASKSETKLRGRKKDKKRKHQWNHFQWEWETRFQFFEDLNQKQTSDINNSSSNHVEEGIKDKVKWIVSSEWWEYSKQCKMV